MSRRELTLIHPILMGSDSRLLDDPAPLTHLELTSSVTTSTGVIIANNSRN